MPFLFDSNALWKRAPEFFRYDALARFGETARYALAETDWALPVPRMSEALRPLWTDALTADAMLLPVARRKQAPFDALLDTAHPFGANGPDYGTLKGRRAAAALFPVNATESVPFLVRLWVVESDNLRQPPLRLEEADSLLQLAAARKLVLFMDTEESRSIQGTSWQLAANLAIQALDAGVADETRLALAADWIATGSVDGEVLGSVGIGNKLACSQGCERRKWIHPACDKTKFDQANNAWYQQNGKFVPSAAVATVSAAFRTVAGFGTLPESRELWPETVAVMHAFVGQNISANLAAVLFSPPAELVLWHSFDKEKSCDPAERIKGILVKLRPEMGARIRLRELPMNDLAKAEEVIRGELGSAIKTGAGIHFNITSGNRMMAMAADRVASASTNSRIRLIYRDIDHPNLDYVQIWHDGGSPHTCTLTPRLSPEREGLLTELLSLDRTVADAAINTIGRLGCW